ncbi:MATE family efflux transporter [Chitinophaga pinensis]|uniref:Multidrug-efflux transporter n=1 Tax=Chitinophaga pinensis (strain ATCC 43595 / DSM 2588 / LMG 13176 / NBRC 15968 / NCIMB 11800 / UQM 2034) TaxID=485918 RepID=A0A979GXH4_CHIPD|nr:MATE family efflux transporter [Chitinophaga pinensis]ACU64638.1 MATE efflux family protein [Chitinophaga pinensis DSM 2588]
MWTKYRQYYKDNFQLAYPVVISQLGHTMVAFSDTIVIGHTGDVPLAAVALGSSLFSIFMVIGIGMSYGLTPLIAQENGRKNLSRCGYLLRHSLAINILLGILLSTVIIIGSNHLDLLGQEERVRVLAKPFLQLLGFSFFPLMIFLTFKQFAEGLGFTRQAMNISIIGNVLNIVLGIILVYGLFGAPKMGVVGVGIATLTDRTLMGVAMAWYVLRSPRFKPYLQEFRQRYLSGAALKQLLGIGTPVALQYVFEISAFSGAIVMAGWIGAREQAAHQIAINLASITYMMASGISAAAGIKSGNHFGAEQWRDLRSSAIASYHMVLVMMGTTALIFMLGCRLLPLMYISDPQVVDIAAHLLIIAAFFQLFDGTQVVGLGILRGLGDVRVPTVITLLAYWGLGLPIGYLFGIHLNFGIQGIWWGLLIGLLTASILLFFRFQHKTKAVLAGALVK